MYYIVSGFFYLLSLLPMRLLYIISDGIYLLVYYIIGYRKKTVMDNLEIAFPEKSMSERVKIAKTFYRNLIDSFIETIKLVSASRRFLEKRITANWEVLDPLFNSGKSCQLHLVHTFNWEWGHHVLGNHTKYQVLVVYMPLSNAVMEKIMYRLRVRYGNKFIAADKMSKSMETFKDTQYLLGLVADQSPGNLHNAYWLNFFGRPTGFVSGPEKGARAGNLPVLFTSIVKPKRGYYQAHLEVACENPGSLKEGELTVLYARYMEKAIRQNPEMWLWSHRRWKHSWNPVYAENWVGEQAPGNEQR
ncbi:MAG TPA: lysophospholipid acyltransferase family protein [Puia sp.]|nr:lysophospholipid acyltransferase family protein [Puia sp.]